MTRKAVRPAPRPPQSRGAAPSLAMPRGAWGRFSRQEGSWEGPRPWVLVVALMEGGTRRTLHVPLFLRPATGPGASIPCREALDSGADSGCVAGSSPQGRASRA